MKKTKDMRVSLAEVELLKYIRKQKIPCSEVADALYNHFKKKEMEIGSVDIALKRTVTGKVLETIKRLEDIYGE